MNENTIECLCRNPTAMKIKYNMKWNDTNLIFFRFFKHFPCNSFYLTLFSD